MTAELAFPAPEPSDTEDVAWTLQTAGTMWARGDAHEAVRWLRRAAEAASDAGNDERALGLARAAADLTAATNLPPSVPPPRPPQRVSADETSRMEAPPLSQTNNPIMPFDDSGYDGEHTIPEGLDAVDAVEKRPPPPPSSRRNTPPARPSTLPGRANLRPRQALRVGVMPSPDDKNVLIVRPLADDEPTPEGHHEALLTALEPGAHLMAKKR